MASTIGGVPRMGRRASGDSGASTARSATGAPAQLPGRAEFAKKAMLERLKSVEFKKFSDDMILVGPEIEGGEAGPAGPPVADGDGEADTQPGRFNPYQRRNSTGDVPMSFKFSEKPVPRGRLKFSNVSECDDDTVQVVDFSSEHRAIKKTRKKKKKPAPETVAEGVDAVGASPAGDPPRFERLVSSAVTDSAAARALPTTPAPSGASPKVE